MVAVAGMVVMLDLHPEAHSAGSFTDLNIEYGELKLALDAASAENRRLRESIADKAKALSDSKQRLLEASGEVAVFKAQMLQMKLRMEALGIGVVAGESRKLEQRLLAAVNQLRATTLEKSKLSEALVRLTEAAGLYVKAGSGQNADLRLTLESELRNSNSALLVESITSCEPLHAPTLKGGRIIGVNESLSLVVINVGFSAGVKNGMPMRVARGQKMLGNIRVVDVREKLAGAVIQDLTSETESLKIGDNVNVAAGQ